MIIAVVIIFHSLVKVNSTNFPAPNIWVFIAQLAEHSSAYAKAMGSKPVEVPKFFNILLDLNNSSDDAQPLSIIVN